MKSRTCGGALAVVMTLWLSSRAGADGGCCTDAGSCIVVANAGLCEAIGGLYKGDGTTCLGQCPRACCLANGTCTDVIALDCATMGGTTMGAGNFCFAVSCLGSCCLANGSCTDGTTNASCINIGGNWVGPNTVCAETFCLEPGACCDTDGSCTLVTQIACTSSGGSFQGELVGCAPNPCPQPGACCDVKGGCTFVLESDCAIAGGNFQGEGASCTPNPCEQTGACCDFQGYCTVVDAGTCAGQPGTYQGDGVPCSPDPCAGACCADDGSCFVASEVNCSALGVIFQGKGTECTICPQPGACCMIDGSCTSFAEPFCALAYGSFHGAASSCAVIVCPLPGTVLSEQKISDTQGNFDGVLANDNNFGASVASIGDLDGDGVGDLAVGAPGDSDGAQSAGAVWILFMASDGTVTTEQKISASAGGFSGALDENDFFGWAVSGLGDLDGDGIGDLAVGAPLDDDGQLDAGAVWILFLNANGTVASHSKISATVGGFGGALSLGDHFGSGLAAIGDLDGDGVGDLAVGAPGEDSVGADRGAVWVLFMNSNGTVASEQEIHSFASPFNFEGHFGSAIAAIDDLDGDGHIDLAVGAPDHPVSINDPTPIGAAWIAFLNADGTVHGQQGIGDGFGGFGGDLEPNDEFGRGLASPGDLNGDGHPDLVVGAPGHDEGLGDAGALWVLFLEPGGTVVDKRKVTDGVGGMSAGTLDAGDGFGLAVGSIGDLDGDGVHDVGAGAWADDDGGADRGAVWLLTLDGAEDVVLVPHEEPAAGSGNHEAIGDFNEDGDQDVVIVIPSQDQIQVFLNDGTNLAGDWLGFTAQAPIAVGNDPNGVAVGFLDGDAHLDLAVANTSDDDVRILLGDGTGAFTFDIDVPVGVNPVDVTAADLTGDAQVDLAVANKGDDTVMILENVTSLASAWQIGLNIPVGSQPVRFGEPEDFDNDKDLDLVLVLRGGGAVTVLLLEDGTQQAQQTVAVGAAPVDIATGDLDGDGDVDAVTADSGAGTVSVVPNVTGPSMGPVIFGAAQPVVVGTNPVSVEMADLDADGDLDLAVVAEDLLLGPAVQVLENHTEEGGEEIIFAPPVSFGIGADPNFIVSADLDGDGVSDLVTVNTDDTPGGGSVTGLITFTCTGDINGDGLVGFADVTQLLIAWGPCPADPAPCPFDIDNNGTVGFADLTLLLLGWGDCS